MIKKVKKLSGGIDQYLLTTPNDILLYKKAIQMKKNIIRIHERAAAGLPISPNYRAAHLLGASADDAPEVLPAEPPANAFPYRGPPRDSTMKPLPPHVVRALQEQQQQQ